MIRRPSRPLPLRRVGGLGGGETEMKDNDYGIPVLRIGALSDPRVVARDFPTPVHHPLLDRVAVSRRAVQGGARQLAYSAASAAGRQAQCRTAAGPAAVSLRNHSRHKPPN